jgi:hypothetical protein
MVKSEKCDFHPAPPGVVAIRHFLHSIMSLTNTQMPNNGPFCLPLDFLFLKRFQTQSYGLGRIPGVKTVTLCSDAPAGPNARL